MSGEGLSEAGQQHSVDLAISPLQINFKMYQRKY
jgi:hypothetical protein